MVLYNVHELPASTCH